MRIVPIITALLVAALLYGVIIERERLLDFARQVSPAALTGDAEAAAAPPVDSAAEDATAEAETAPADGAVRVMAKRSVAEVIDSAVVLRGETEALRQVDVQAETTGKVISTPLRKGAFVTAGQTLCELDPGTRQASLAEARARLAEARARSPEAQARIPEAEARLEEARARLEEATINLNASSKLSEDGFASTTRVAASEASLRSAEAAVSSAEAGVEAARSGLDSLQANIESAEAAVARAQTEIDRLTVVAPFDGVLESDTAELGALLSAGGPGGAHCATVLQLDPIKLVGFVPETDVARVALGARAGARLTGGETVMGQVTFVSRSADSVTRTFRVEIEVPNADLAIRDGQTAEIGIEADGAMAHLLPQSTLTLNDDGTLGVRVVNDAGEAQFMAVTLLRDTRQGVWLTGLPDTVNVITVGQEYVTDGVPVSPSYEEVMQ
ncbi:efflux RND transporter periplasmic adaptor subunit [Aestuariicoccus sp. MJ-SS9]|uniref:efflux RND transporter periplasmic adaptor subunit n=1 Tax=Aestuariicoccus sp. MJ-SS9 TaxID=3079855 RepID=UPI0029156FE3|nr:efflux RND transporter periplasmic adaptor subunit [Aestuariicoccus sp. MJ-SS9]MDU8911119.1 efflux RND transporter periplasmic adaptor subunit [Aestuariicoccus sp. MJ-SS9]